MFQAFGLNEKANERQATEKDEKDKTSGNKEKSYWEEEARGIFVFPVPSLPFAGSVSPSVSQARVSSD